MSKIVLIFLLCAMAFPTLANENPLFPVKVDNPRATMKTFYQAMNDYKAGLKSSHKDKKSQKIFRIQDAVRCLDGQGASEEELKEAAIYLKEVIDRVIVLNYDYIPEETTEPFWRLKDTEIRLRPIQEGDRKGQWLITQDTWKRAKTFYKRVKDLDYLEGSGQGAGYQDPWVEQVSPAWARGQTLHLHNWQWLGLVIFLIMGFVVSFLYHITLPLFRGLLHKYTKWSYALLKATERPLGYVIGAAIFWMGLRVLQLEGWTFFTLNFVVQIMFGAGLIAVFYMAVEVLGRFLREKAANTATDLDDQLVPFAEKCAKVLVVLLGTLMILQNLGVNVFSLLAGLGLGGLAFALAAKDTAANLFGSVMLLVDRPFRLGDWINVNGVDGTVEEIGFRSTRMRTFYDSVISVPNAIVAAEKIDNYGLRENRRIQASIGLTYDTPPEKIEAFLEGLKNIILSHPDTNKDRFHVVFEGFGASSLNILLYAFVQTPTWAEELVARQNIYLQILNLAKDIGVEFAFPTQTLHMVSDPEHPFQEKELQNIEELKKASRNYIKNGEKSKPQGLGLFRPPYVHTEDSGVHPEAES